MTGDYSLILLTLVSVVSTVLTLGEASDCPKNPLAKVQECTDIVLPDFNRDSSVSGPQSYREQVQHASETCRDSRLRDVADCIQDILDRCRGTTDAEQSLQRLFDQEKTISTVDYFCKHINVYQEHAECIASHHEETTNCTADAHKSFLAKYKAGANMDVLITDTCTFHGVARTCLTNTTHRHCGGTAANFVYTLLTGLMPPICETINPEYSLVHTTRRYYRENKEWDPNAADTMSFSFIALMCSFIYFTCFV